MRASSYGQVPFSYQTPSECTTSNTQKENTTDTNKEEDDVDEEFIPHPNFSIPPGIEIVSVAND